jgi:uncharacterized damage-inducible protein DinB
MRYTKTPCSQQTLAAVMGTRIASIHRLLSMLDNYRFLSRYNRSFNERLYDACDTLTDDARKLDRGAFFGSIHLTLNHLMWGDIMWLGRFFAQDPASQTALTPELLQLPEGARFETVLFDDFAALRSRRVCIDKAIDCWLADLPPGFTQRTMCYNNTKGVHREHPVWQAMAHLFNHQTHHRGQVTTLLMQAGVDVGTTDLIALAGNP